MQFELYKTTKLKEAIDVINKFIDNDVYILFNNTGLHIDQSMVQLHIPNEHFNLFKCDNDLCIKMFINDIVGIFKNTKKTNGISFSISADNDNYFLETSSIPTSNNITKKLKIQKANIGTIPKNLSYDMHGTISGIQLFDLSKTFVSASAKGTFTVTCFMNVITITLKNIYNDCIFENRKFGDTGKSFFDSLEKFHETGTVNNILQNSKFYTGTFDVSLLKKIQKMSANDIIHVYADSNGVSPLKIKAGYLTISITSN